MPTILVRETQPQYRIWGARQGLRSSTVVLSNHTEGRSPETMYFLNFLSWLSTKTNSERGAGLAEYALLLALIAIACITALTTLGTKISSVLTSIAGQL